VEQKEMTKVSQRSIKKEMKEHPWATKKQATRIATDHSKRKKK
jgi:hypothetical protein